MRSRILCAAVVLAAAVTVRADTEPPALSTGIPTGPHAVGFRVLGHLDATRRLAGAGPRPVQISVWYPAALDETRAALRYRDYVLVAAEEKTLAPPADPAAALAGYTAFLSRQGLAAGAIQSWLDAPLAARRDASPARGRFPVVLIAPGNGGAVPDQAVLGEMLASHGFVVATTPSPIRLGVPMESDADVLPMARDEARDLAVALEAMRSLSDVDASRVGLVGYSFGARAALLSTGLPGVRALVSLDGGIGAATAKGWLPAAALDRRAVRVPILHIYEDVEEFMRPDFTLLDSLARAPQMRVKVAGMHHMDLVTYGFAAASLPQLAEGNDAPALSARLRAVATYTLWFLQAHVAGDAAASRHLSATPEAGGFAAGLLDITRRPIR
jgi:dienelactone hydrolase